MNLNDEQVAQLTTIMREMQAEETRHNAQQAASLQHFQEVFLQMGGDNQQPPAAKRLGVGWIGQNTAATTDDWSNSDCGCACVAMWLHFVGIDKTVDDVSAATGLSRGYTYTLPAHLQTAAKHYGLTLARVMNLSVDAVKAEVLRAVPIIVLVHYGSLPKRFDQKFKAGHWIIIVGCDADKVLYHDPYWPDRSSGAYLEMTNAQFEKAMQDCAIDGNTPNQGLKSWAV